MSFSKDSGKRRGWRGFAHHDDPAFPRTLDDMNEVFVADVHRDQRIWTEQPELAVPPSQPGRGRPAQKRQASVEPVTVESLVTRFARCSRPTRNAEAKGFAAAGGMRCVLRDSTRRELRVDIAHRRVWVWDGEEETPRCWHLIVRREVKSEKMIKNSLSKAPVDTPLLRLAQMQGQRYWGPATPGCGPSGFCRLEPDRLRLFPPQT